MANRGYVMFNQISIYAKVLDPRLGSSYPLPSYTTIGSAGLDLRAMMAKPLMLAPGMALLINTGLSIYISHPEVCGLIYPRSGLANKGIILGNSVGVIDSDYQGPIMVSLWNSSEAKYLIQVGDRIAQLIITPVFRAELNIVNEYPATTTRGGGGFGSTGDQ